MLNQSKNEDMCRELGRWFKLPKEKVDLWELRYEDIDHVSDMDILRFLRSHSVSYHEVLPMSLTDTIETKKKGRGRLSDWHFVVRVSWDVEMSSDPKKCDILDVFPNQRRAEAVVEQWYQRTRHLSLGEYLLECMPGEDEFDLERMGLGRYPEYERARFQEVLDDPDFEPPMSEFDVQMKDYTKEQMIEIIKLTRGKWLEVRSQEDS